MTKRVIKKHVETEEKVKKKESEIKSFLKILLIVMSILVICYFVIAIFITKDINIFGK